MNKTKLEVIKINEDVITTSTICKNIDAFEHRYIENYNNGDGYYYQYIYKKGELHLAMEGPAEVSDWGITSNGWYYRVQDGAPYTKCDDNCEHPIGAPVE